MTRQEAITILDTLWSNPLFNESHREALKIGVQAIKALEQEPCEDCINRKDLMRHLYDCKSQSEGITRAVIVAIESYVEQMSPVVPVRTKGEWINISNRNGKTVALRCSICGKSPRRAIRSDFCPNCGADMREATYSWRKNGI